MENLDEQGYVNDPNQLDLFAGILYTPEQEKHINAYLERQKTTVSLNTIANQRNEELLINSGFRLGIDFQNTFKTEIITREVTLGSSYDKTQFTTELTFENTTGFISLNGKQFYNGELINPPFSVYFERDKVQCNSIQEQYRYVKPTTLLEKLKIHNSRQETLFEEYKKKVSLKQNIIEKYTKLYPKATVTSKTDWSKYSGSFDIIEVAFSSGSYIQFKLDIYHNKEFVYKKYDAEFERMNSDELLEKFSKQEALK
jgi:hypothetical protein